MTRTLVETKGALMVRLTVLYGQPADPQAFDAHYAHTHLPLARKMRGWSRWTLEKVISPPGEPPSPYYLVVGLYAHSADEVAQILASPEARAAAADVSNFATGGVTYLLTEVEEVEFTS
jgi:uncharacterized protein (TIGR02118 family)